MNRIIFHKEIYMKNIQKYYWKLYKSIYVYAYVFMNVCLRIYK